MSNNGVRMDKNMAKTYWKCKICGYEVENESEKQQHLKKMITDPDHQLVTFEDFELEEENKNSF